MEHGKQQPFLLITSYLKPHNPFMPAERFAKMFPAENMKLPDTWGKVDRSKVPVYIQRFIDHPAATPELLDPRWAKVRIASYYACAAQMDDNVGRVLGALRELDLEKDTIIVYTSDHGDMLGEHGLWQKFVFYEPSVCVPLIFRVPGLTAENVRSKTPVSLVQMVPTLLELCGLPAPSGLDGESFVGDLREPTRTRDTTVFSENNLGSSSAMYMMRRGDDKYSYYVHDMPELYNLRRDPKEMNNLAIQPEFKGKVDEIKAQLFAWHDPSKGI
jgi:choline-sulfatase